MNGTPAITTHYGSLEREYVSPVLVIKLSAWIHLKENSTGNVIPAMGAKVVRTTYAMAFYQIVVDCFHLDMCVYISYICEMFVDIEETLQQNVMVLSQ